MGGREDGTVQQRPRAEWPGLICGALRYGTERWRRPAVPRSGAALISHVAGFGSGSIRLSGCVQVKKPTVLQTAPLCGPGGAALTLKVESCLR